jgi:hypothetical protein
MIGEFSSVIKEWNTEGICCRLGVERRVRGGNDRCAKEAYLAAGNTPISCSNGLKGSPSTNLSSILSTSSKSAAKGAKW